MLDAEMNIIICDFILLYVKSNRIFEKKISIENVENIVVIFGHLKLHFYKQ